MRRRSAASASRRALSAIGASTLPVALFAQAAAADADTGRIYEKTIALNNGSEINACSEAAIGNYGVGRGFGTTWSLNPDATNKTCTGGVNAPPGYLVVGEWTFRNGSVCNSGSTTNNVTTYGLTLWTDCSNPSGSQQWYSWDQSGWYKGQYCTANDFCSNGYTYGNVRQSPSLNF